MILLLSPREVSIGRMTDKKNHSQNPRGVLYLYILYCTVPVGTYHNGMQCYFLCELRWFRHTVFSANSDAQKLWRTRIICDPSSNTRNSKFLNDTIFGSQFVKTVPILEKLFEIKNGWMTELKRSYLYKFFFDENFWEKDVLSERDSRYHVSFLRSLDAIHLAIFSGRGTRERFLYPSLLSLFSAFWHFDTICTKWKFKSRQWSLDTPSWQQVCSSS